MASGETSQGTGTRVAPSAVKDRKVLRRLLAQVRYLVLHRFLQSSIRHCEVLDSLDSIFCVGYHRSDADGATRIIQLRQMHSRGLYAQRYH